MIFFKSSGKSHKRHTYLFRFGKKLTITVEFDVLAVLLTTVDRESKVVFRETLSIYPVWAL